MVSLDEGDKRTSISSVNTNDQVEVRKFYPEYKLLVITSLRNSSSNEGETMNISTLHIPSLNMIHSSSKVLEANKHFILNDSLPNLAIFESDKNYNSTKIKIYNLLSY